MLKLDAGSYGRAAFDRRTNSSQSTLHNRFISENQNPNKLFDRYYLKDSILIPNSLAAYGPRNTSVNYSMNSRIWRDSTAENMLVAC
jgi:hypothetical protein